MWMSSGGRVLPAPSARANGAPSRTRPRASRTSAFMAVLFSVSAPASRARMSGTPLAVRMASVEAKRAALMPRMSRPNMGMFSSLLWKDSRAVGAFSE